MCYNIPVILKSKEGVIMSVCNMDCLNCIYSDCINDGDFTYEELSSPDFAVEVSREKELARMRSRRYSETHREEIRAKSLVYYYAHKEQVTARVRQWNKDNPLRVSAGKRKRWSNDPEKYRQKQREYRHKVNDSLPHCDSCEGCISVLNSKTRKGDEEIGHQRLCVPSLRLIDYKVSSSPRWCPIRGGEISDKDI